MRMRIATSGAVLVGALGLAMPVSAQESAILLLKSGARLAGDLVDMGGSGFTMNISGQSRVVPTGDAAVIAFDGDARNLPAGEVERTDDGHVLVMRNGRSLTKTPCPPEQRGRSTPCQPISGVRSRAALPAGSGPLTCTLARRVPLCGARHGIRQASSPGNSEPQPLI